MLVNEPSVDDLLRKALALFKVEFKKDAEIAACGPGRVNLIGEHTDYNDGFVLPMALELVSLIVGSHNNTNEVRIYTATHAVDDPHKIKFSLMDGVQKGRPKWANYVKGVIAFFTEVEIPGFDAVVLSNVPVGAGLSSSAALEVAMYTFLEVLTGKVAESPIKKALQCQKAEHVYADVPCGIMDQIVSVLGKEDHVLLIDCRSSDVTYVPFKSSDVVVLITNSKVKHELSNSQYAVRRSQCEEVASLLGKKSLRNAGEADLLNLEKIGINKILMCRARHVITEIKRTEEGAKALEKNDFVKFGKLMIESHNSLRDDYEVSCKELDEIVEATLGLDGVFGSRMTGGGFGGCTVTLLKVEAVDNCIAHIKKKCSVNPDFYICKPSNGSREIAVPAN